jgi:enoyl-CoA hydratase
MNTLSTLENLSVETKNNILYITIVRESKLNALNFKTLAEIKEVFEDAYENKSVKGIIITGQGNKAFVAGADISEFQTINEVNARKFAETGQEIFSTIESCPKPVIAAVNGFALGGGCELAMACHMRVATTNAKFGQPEVNLGLIPGYGGTQRLTNLIGRGKAIELLLTGDMIDAQEAFNLHLVNHLVENQQDLIPKCEEILNKIFTKAPLAIGMIVECVNAATYNDGENGYRIEANSFGNCCKTLDFKEGVKAFLEKRKPEFRGA